MARRDPFPGSIYAVSGKLRIKIRVPHKYDDKGEPVYHIEYTGLADTAANRAIARTLKKQLWERYHYGKQGPVTGLAPTVAALFEEFLRHRTRTQKTEGNYRLAFRTIIRGDYPFDSAAIEDDIRRFVATTKIGAVSVNTYLRSVRAFLSWAERDKGLQVPQRIMTRYGRPVRTNVLEFTEAEIGAMLTDREDPELTDMIELMVETGARPVDVLTLKWDQVDFERSAVTWLNKITKREERRPISRKALAVFMRRRAERGRVGKVFRWSHASLSPVSKQFKALMQRVGIDPAGRSFKHLRTTFKRRLMERGLPFEVQMYLMRHSTPDITLGHYTAVPDTEIMRRFLDS